MTSTFLIQKFFLNNALQKTIILIKLFLTKLFLTKLFLTKYSWMKFTGEWLWPAEEVVLSGA